MRKPEARQLALDLLSRSKCSVQVAAVIFDDYGIFAWGWNSAGDGYGLHAEAHALSRANRRRLGGASIAIAGLRRRRIVPSVPCEDCQKRLDKVGIGTILVQNRDGDWVRVLPEDLWETR